MSATLVAFERCGCAAFALMSPADDEPGRRNAAAFQAAAANRGLEVREIRADELPDSFRCAAHAEASL